MNSAVASSPGSAPVGLTPTPGPCSAGADLFIMNSSIWLRNLALRDISASCSHVSSSLFIVAFGGALSCVQYCGRAAPMHPEAAVRCGGRPTHLSATCFRISRSGFFGRKTLRRTSQQRPNAACAKPSATLVAANGRGMRLRQSLARSSGAGVCATSKSNQNSNRGNHGSYRITTNTFASEVHAGAQGAPRAVCGSSRAGYPAHLLISFRSRRGFLPSGHFRAGT